MFNNRVSCHRNKKNFVGLVFLDLKKASDAVLHDILLHKLNHYGIRGKVNDLFRSYLAERKQCVSINNYNSAIKTAQFGVP